MNQTPRQVNELCIVCQKNTVTVKQIYNPHVSNWQTYDMPICAECRKKEAEKRCTQMKTQAQITEMEAMEQLLACLKSRFNWYQEAVEVKSGRKPLENGMGLPYKSIAFCEGAAAELQNTIQMLEHYIKICTTKSESEENK